MILIDDNLLAEFRANLRCEWCLRLALVQPHHLRAKGMGGGSQLDIRANLIALCTRCHHSHHYSNRPTRQELLEVVAAREGRTVAEIEAEVWRLLREKT